MTAACIRHGISLGHLGHSTPHCIERLDKVAARIKELKLLDMDLSSQAISRADVESIRSRVKVSVSEAARALLGNGHDVDGACALMGEVQGAVEVTTNLHDDPTLCEMQRRLIRRNVAPNLDTIAVAVHMCRDESLTLESACEKFGVVLGSNRKSVADRIARTVSRIKEADVLTSVDAWVAAQVEAAAAGASGEPGEPSEAGGASGAETSARTGLSCRPGTHAPWLEDEEWIEALRQRVGPMPARERGKRKVLPDTLYLKASIELSRMLGNPDLEAICQKFEIPLDFQPQATYSHLRELRDRIKKLALLDVPPEEIQRPPPPPHSCEQLVSLQLRTTRGSNTSTMPDLDNVGVALDCFRDSIDVYVASVRRRLDLGTNSTRKKAIAHIRDQLAGLDRLDAVVTVDDVESVRQQARPACRAPPSPPATGRPPLPSPAASSPPRPALPPSPQSDWALSGVPHAPRAGATDGREAARDRAGCRGVHSVR